MKELEVLIGPPADLEVWLLLGYAIVVLAGARLTEALAQMHFRRARNSAEHGFRYDSDADHYDCPHGERLRLHVIDPDKWVAVYRAPASTCAECPSKGACTPHDEGRHIYRPLAEWAETDVGRFHQWLSLLMAGSAVALSLISIVRWTGKPGTGLLMLVFVVSITVAWRDAWRLYACRQAGRMGRPSCAPVHSESRPARDKYPMEPG
jgi:hypothetical protein